MKQKERDLRMENFLTSYMNLSFCYRFNYVSPKFIPLSPNPNICRGGFEEIIMVQLDNEDEALIIELVVL